jgi:hypothetical protein
VPEPAADGDFSDGDVARGLWRREPALDLVRVRDVGLSSAGDAAVPAWAAREGRVPLTHDVTTLSASAVERVRAGRPMPGVVQVGQLLPLGGVIEDLFLLAGASLEGEREGRVQYLPLRRGASRGRRPKPSR